jgi:hypothetical protein
MADTTYSVTIEYSDPRFFEALADPEGFLPFLADAMQNIVDAYQEIASVYAPESEANRPGRVDKDGRPMGYYERGRGWWYPLTTHNTMGMGAEIPLLKPSTKAPKTMSITTLMAQGFTGGVTGYKLIPNSEQMNERWTNSVQQSASEVIGRLNNSASYSGLVQGMSQTALHRSRDWRTVVDAWAGDELSGIIIDETMQALKAYYNL